MNTIADSSIALRSNGGEGKARNRRLGVRRCRGTAATARASDAWLAGGLATLLVAAIALAAAPADGMRMSVLLQSDAALRVLGFVALIASTTGLLMNSRRDWMRLAERERRAPGLLTSLGLDARVAHAAPTSSDAAPAAQRREAQFAQILEPQPRGI